MDKAKCGRVVQTCCFLPLFFHPGNLPKPKNMSAELSGVFVDAAIMFWYTAVSHCGPVINTPGSAL